MSAVARNAASAAGKIASRAASKVPNSHKQEAILKKGAKRDPELYVGDLSSSSSSWHVY